MSRLNDLSQRDKILILALLVLVTCSLLVVLAEGAVRFRHWLKYGDMWGIEDTYTVDKKTGLRIPVPGSKFGSITINLQGFRSPEIDTPKPAATIRLAFLGASTKCETRGKCYYKIKIYRTVYQKTFAKR